MPGIINVYVYLKAGVSCCQGTQNVLLRSPVKKNLLHTYVFIKVPLNKESSSQQHDGTNEI